MWLIRQKRETQKTLFGTKNEQKNAQKPNFYSAKMAPQKVDNLITFKGANLITLWRPKGGQPNNSPAYIYIYLFIYLIIRQHPFKKWTGFASIKKHPENRFFLFKKSPVNIWPPKFYQTIFDWSPFLFPFFFFFFLLSSSSSSSSSSFVSSSLSLAISTSSSSSFVRCPDLHCLVAWILLYVSNYNFLQSSILLRVIWVDLRWYWVYSIVCHSIHQNMQTYVPFLRALAFIYLADL